jgi:PAS domain S-box-containing protein
MLCIVQLVRFLTRKPKTIYIINGTVLFRYMAPENYSSYSNKYFGLEERDLVRIWVIASFVMVSVLVTISAFTMPLNDIYAPLLFLFPQLYYIPIILISIWYPRYGLQATVLIVAAFLGVTSFFYFRGTTPIGPFITGMNAAMFLWVVIATSYLANEKGLLKYANIFRNAGAGILLCDPEGRTIIDVNKKLADIIGYTQEELKGLPVSELWEDPQEGVALFKGLRKGGFVQDKKFSLLGKSGEIKWVEISCKQSVHHPQVECTIIDVTEREQKEVALIEKKESLQNLVNSSQDLIFMQDVKGQFCQFYWARADEFGIDPAEMIGKTPYHLFSHNIADEMEHFKEEVLESGETLNFDFAENIAGMERHFSIILGSVNDHEGKTIGVIGTMHDITGQSKEDLTYMKMERELDRWRNFINTAAHELRTPLQPILGYLHLILEDPASFALDSETVKLLHLCLENVERERRVVDRMLELGIMDSARIHLNLSDIPLRQFITTINRIGGYELQADMEIEVPPNTTVSADRDHIFQVLDGLISNAVQYNDPPRSVHIKYNEQNSHHIISVTDNGVGIPNNSLNAIFEPFYLADQENLSREYGRIGLGLSIAKKYVEMHGGTIDVKSTVGVGSTFTVQLPKVVSNDPA